MRMLFSIFLIFCAACAFANNKLPIDGIDKCLGIFTPWKLHSYPFGKETVTIRFKQEVIVKRNDSLFTAYAIDSNDLTDYVLTGYLPPKSNIDPDAWFDKIRSQVSEYPYQLINSNVSQNSQGDWIMDYTFQHYVQNLTIQARAYATPYNGYILKCIKSNGSKDDFSYFLDNFKIKR